MPQSLNTLVVKVLGDIKDVQGKLKTLDKRVGATNKKVAGFNKSIKAGVDRFIRYAAVIGTAVIALRKMTRFISSSISAYNEQVLSLTKLETTLKSTGRFTLETRDKMVEFANEMQRTTGISDTLILSAEAIFATFTQINTEAFPEAITLAADMSKLFGQDLQQSVIQLGTALNDPIAGVGRLKRIGISFSEDQRESIKQFVEQNDLMSAQRVILDELQVELGGTAIAMGKTMAGQMDVLKNSFTDMKEEIGFLTESGLPALIILAQDIVRVFTKIISKFNEARRELKAYREELGEKTVEELKLAISWQDAHVQSLADTIAPIQRNIEALEGLDKRNRTQRKQLKELNKQYDELIPTYDDASDVLNDLRDALEEAEKEQKDFNVVGEETNTGLENQIEVLAENSDEWARYGRVMRSATEENINAVVKVEDMSIALDEQQTTIREWSRSIKDASGSILEDIDLVIKKENELKEFTENQFKTSFVGAWEEMFDTTRSITENMKESAKSFFATFLKGLAKQFAALAAGNLILLQFGLAARNLAASGVFFAAASAIQNLAHGGIATRTTLANIGEGSNPEAVIPLSSESLRPFAQAIVGEIGKLQSNGSPNIAMGNNIVNVQVGTGPIITTVQKALDNRQLRVNQKAIR